MRYMGNKRRIVKDILPLMLAELKSGQCFIDAFCGSCSIIQNVPKGNRRIANDANGFLVAMWERLVSGKWSPPTRIEKNYYDDVKESYRKRDGRYDDATIGWVSFMASRNGRDFSGGYSGHDVKGRDYISENIRGTVSQVDGLRGVEWFSGSYADLTLPANSLIYCDPPYKDTTQYSTVGEFDYPAFYDWCRSKSAEGHTVFVSEYSMPADFKEVWHKDVNISINPTVTTKATERLYRI